MQSELDAAREERDALLMLKQEKEERERAEAELALARTRSAEKKAQLAAAKARLAELQRTPTAQFTPAAFSEASATAPDVASPTTARRDSPGSAGRARSQPFGDPLAMHSRPKPQGARRRAPARGLLAQRKKQGRH